MHQPLLSSQALPAITPLLPLLPMSRVIPIPGEFFKACFRCQQLTEALFLASFLSLLSKEEGGREEDLTEQSCSHCSSQQALLPLLK